MGIHIIKMPDIGEGIAEVELVEWHVAEGESVVEDQVLADVMTDKATVQVPSPVHGKVLALGGKVGEVMAVGSELVRLEVEGQGNEHLHSGKSRRPAASVATVSGSASSEHAVRVGQFDDSALGKDAGSTASAAAGHGKDSNKAAETLAHHENKSGHLAAGQVQGHGQGQASSGSNQPAAPSGANHSSAGSDARVATASAAGHGSGMAARPDGEKPLASPAVRKRAWDLGIELQYVAGSGAAGQITHGDLDLYIERGAKASATARPSAYARRDDEQDVPVVGLRRRIAEKMQESKRRIPHFSYVEEVDVTELEALRQKLNAQWGAERGKLTLLPLLARAVINALREFPQINARYDDEAGVVKRYGAVHLGVAAQTAAGLMVPVVRHAEALDLWACGAEITRLAEATRAGKAARDELSGSTITLSSLGPLGGIVSTPVINHPEVAIVGVNRMVERPMIVGGAVVARKMMNLSSSFDHRVVDGMDAAQFIQRVRGYLECPAMLFIE
ncbi:dihydrolipoamide acetyltransferase family protein [Pusillimonas sp. ANT_WB101]|uniref:dihydrolipoamide acetyltransferase family protein n=1 Tax=Pusillimonas sp. ANT_WB101 TaxID=2597356 RepID=UPI0011EEC701|nr:dihydrolipoamide acetyltransferase family protein [Pusillimonas sp. ANT_WB101]KAA0911193.1 2-oxo acid dehydrogenase subunit E2 [Pusillimonas sp. ANT_WB101]